MRSRRLLLVAFLFGVVALLGLRALVRFAAGGNAPGQRATYAPTQPPLPFVRVDSSRFTIDGTPFRFIGANSIYLGFYPGRGFAIAEAIRSARENGVTVLRIYLWLGDAPWGGRTMEEYDAVLDAAAREGVYILAVLTDCCPGDWGRTPEEYTKKVPQCDLTSASGLALYKEQLKSLVTRRNTVNGRVYRDDPTIMAWDVANEPVLDRYEPAEIHAWLNEVVAYVKSLDRNHLVTIGIVDNAAYDEPGPAYEALDVPGLDFHSFHFYPAGFVPQGGRCTSDAPLRLQALQTRAQTWAKTGKPVVLEEFGYGSQRELERVLGRAPDEDELACWLSAYRKTTDTAFAAGVSGVMFWGWGVPETRAVELWWRDEDHDATELEFCALTREYQMPAPAQP